jgi:hypothetical protein
MKKSTLLSVLAVVCILLLISCAPEPTCAEDIAIQEKSGFVGGLLHGIVLPIAVIAKIFNIETGIYALNNTGTWYWVGYFLGFAVLGGGMFKSNRKGR